MIYVRSDNIWAMVKGCYEAINKAEPSPDPDIYKEDTGVLIFEAGYVDPALVVASGNRLECTFDQGLYFPKHHSLKRDAEDDYWNEKLIKEGFLAKVASHLLKFPYSRSCLYNFWDNADFDVANPKGNCITQIYFRARKGQLDMHAHIRANDVHRCLLMDLAYLLYTHDNIARKLSMKKGEYVHVADSLHVYRKSVTEFNDQLKFMRTESGIWPS